jgi:CarD family transcriptional regulator
MNYHVGDQVVHSTYGLGEIIQLDEKMLLGNTKQYYVVQIRDLKIWVPVSEGGRSSLRNLTPASEFENLFVILASPAQPLPDDRFQRKTYLTDQLKDGKLASVCQAVRDLAYFKRSKKFNEYDKAIMERAESFLVDEWAISLSVSVIEAKQHLNQLLGTKIS